MAKQSTSNEKSWQKAVGAALGAATFVAILALAFLWPGRLAEPRNVPIAITGSNPAQLEMIKKGIEASAGDAVELVSVANRDEAMDKIEKREAYGALVLTMPNPEVLTASANGQAINAITNGIATNLQSKLAEMAASMPKSPTTPAVTPKISVKVTDVVPVHRATFDIAQLALPLLFGGVIGGVLSSVVARNRGQRLAMLAIYAVSVGLAMFLILQTWFDVLPGDFWAITGAFSLGVFATASFVAGSYALAGVPGMGLAILFTLLLANPISGLALPPLFMPEPWGVIGQSLTIGAGGALVRGAAYFPVAEVVSMPIVVLSIWSVLGAGVVLVRNREGIRE